ncbi:unnamed protein product, partial [Iphiclides podalirius]
MSAVLARLKVLESQVVSENTLSPAQRNARPISPPPSRLHDSNVRSLPLPDQSASSNDVPRRAGTPPVPLRLPNPLQTDRVVGSNSECVVDADAENEESGLVTACLQGQDPSPPSEDYMPQPSTSGTQGSTNTLISPAAEEQRDVLSTPMPLPV